MPIDPLDDVTRLWAPRLHVPAGISAEGIMRALAAQETGDSSRWGASKHESAYCYSGRYHSPAMKPFEWRYGCMVHSSWGPWQIMYPTAMMYGFNGDPLALRYPSTSADILVRHLNAKVFDTGFTDLSIDDVFDAWNSGTARDGLVPARYIDEAREHYKRIVGGLPRPTVTA